MRPILRLAGLAAALAAVGCPPPPDLPLGAAKSPPPAPSPVAKPEDPGTKNGAPSPSPPGSEAPAAPATGEPQTPVVSATPKTTVYERLAGGVFVARCPACGAVQPPKSTQCPSCSQVLRPWRQEQLCTVCTGSGRCDRCGDDRACLSCDGQGACPSCAGSGKIEGEKCADCGGNGRCLACAGDGWREATNHDFAPSETSLPGVCPTCWDGSGLCPDCGTSTKDRAGGTCLTCGGDGVCFDCRGTGVCSHDAGDGLCLVCSGAGREVADGDPPKATDRVWNLRNASGTIVTARVLDRPDPNVAVQITQGGTSSRSALTRAQVAPLSYWLAKRDWTPLEDAKGRMDLGTIALSSGFWPLAQNEFRRAMAIDPSMSAEAAGQLREIAERRADRWRETAESAMKAGDRDGAARLLDMVRFEARGTPQATRAGVMLIQIDRERAEEEANLDAAAKTRRAEEARARAARAVTVARLRIDRARRLLDDAQHAAAADPSVERLLQRADDAAWTAMRTVQRAAFRDPVASVAWPAKPDGLVRDARTLRAEIATVHAAREVAGGRFDYGARLARRAIALDASNARAASLRSEAELGLARRGVLLGSPAPKGK